MTNIVKPDTLYEVQPDGRWAFFLDNSKLAAFGSCEWLFRYRYIQNIRPKGKSYPMSIGSWWSLVLERCYNDVANHKSLTQARAIQHAVAAWKEMKMDELKQYAPKKFESFGGAAGAVVMIDEYWRDYAQHDQQRWNIVAAEAGFGRKREVCIGENDRVVVYYIGKPDLFIINDGRLIPLDHKTVNNIRSDLTKKYKPHPQMQGYIVVGEVLARQLGYDVTVDRCIMNIAGRTPPSDKPRDGVKKARFIRIHPGYSRDELAEWRSQTLLKVTRLRHVLETDEWTRNEAACHLYAGCDYRGIDSVTPSARPDIINAGFVKVEPWVPYEVEEDDENGF